jgi:hypothetical protein
MLPELERTTSAEGAMRRVRTRFIYLPLCFGGFNLSTVVTSTGQTGYVVPCDTGTRADPACPVSVPADTPSRDILEIRFVSGLTWDELADLFEVSRRRVHHWAAGEMPKAENVERIRNVLLAIRRLRRSSSIETRRALLTPVDGETPLNLLKARRWVDAIAAMGKVTAIALTSLPKAGPSALHPTDYLEALTDRPAPTTGRILPGRSRRIPRRTS